MTDGNAILVVEDERLDCELLKCAFQWGHIHNPLAFVHDARDAVKYLQGAGHFADRTSYPEAGALILDLNLPAMNGLEFLAWLKGHPQYKLEPIIVLTVSDRETDRSEAYGLGATDYLIKPLTLDELALQVKNTFTGWVAPGYVGASP